MKKILFVIALLFMTFFCYAKSNISYSASSYLQEADIVYSPDNLKNIRGLPWASKSGFGLHETITISNLDKKDKYLIFYNGYQSKEKPYLYKDNSRLKTGKIFNSKGRFLNFNFEDTSKYQIIDISELLDDTIESTISIEIVDIYPGEKYKDLCIQAIIPLKSYFYSDHWITEIAESYSFQRLKEFDNAEYVIGEDLYYANHAGFPETVFLSNSDIKAYYWKKNDYTVLKVLDVYNKIQLGIFDVFFDLKPVDIENILGVKFKNNNTGYYLTADYTYFIEFEKTNDKIIRVTFGESL